MILNKEQGTRMFKLEEENAGKLTKELVAEKVKGTTNKSQEYMGCLMENDIRESEIIEEICGVLIG